MPVARVLVAALWCRMGIPAVSNAARIHLHSAAGASARSSATTERRPAELAVWPGAQIALIWRARGNLSCHAATCISAVGTRFPPGAMRRTVASSRTIFLAVCCAGLMSGVGSGPGVCGASASAQLA